MTGIIIPALHKSDITTACIESVFRNSTDFKLYLIDNDSEDNKSSLERLDVLREHCYVSNAPPKNVTDSWNQGIDLALADGCENVLIMNNDIVVGKDWLKVLIDTLESNKDIWCLSPDAVQNEIIDYNFDKLVLERLEMPNDIQDRPGRFCFICPSHVFTTIGKFDPQLHYWYGDDDFELRLRLAGHGGVYCRKVLIHHFESLTVNERRENDPDFRKRLKHDAEYFGQKWQ